MRGMLEELARILTRVMQRMMPDPFVVAVLLTLVTFVAYGDQWTNMLQPFWALPLLGITGVKARDIIGYTAVLLLAAQVPFVAALYVGW